MDAIRNTVGDLPSPQLTWPIPSSNDVSSIEDAFRAGWQALANELGVGDPNADRNRWNDIPSNTE
jgi:hypothetical protein